MEDLSEEARLLNRRQSILDHPIGSFRGVNSLHNFASSFTRAQSFAAHKIDPDINRKRSYFAESNDSEDDELFDPDTMTPSARGERLSTVINDLRGAPLAYQGLNAAPSHINEVFYQDDIDSILLNANQTRRESNNYLGGIPISKKRLLPSQSHSSFRLAISFATTASQFGLKRVEDSDGNIVTILAGQSTAPQTVLNSVNVLIGVGLLALPVGLLKSGWVLGLSILLLCCLATCWTASLLSKCLDTDNTLMTYADLGYASYGSTAKLLISVMFSVDLIGAGISLVLLFSDSLYSLIGDEQVWTKLRFKYLAFFVLTPFTFMPLPILSIFLLLGIMATISIILLVMSCGLLKTTAPGSLIQAMPTNLWPNSTRDLFIAIGIIMAPFGGHAIFPNLRSDMRHPHKFNKTLLTTYSITGLADSSMAIIGFLMFGALCSNEVTSTLIETAGYPAWIYPLVSSLICIVPLAKTPLNAKPIISTLDGILNLDLIAEGDSKLTNFSKSFGRVAVRIGVNAAFVAFAILVPDFEKIIGIMGSSICFLVCIILPCLFYLKLCKYDIQASERLFIKLVICGSLVLAAACTWYTIGY